MQVPGWKKWLSYLWEFHLESAPSEINPHLYVSLKRGRFQLCSEHAVYSYGDLYRNFDKAFSKIPFGEKKEWRVLVLGLGLGSIPQLLEQKYRCNFHCTAVEVDETVVELAQDYTLSDLKAPIEVICTDAWWYVQQSTEQFDLIAMDVFLDDVIPENFESTDFLEALKDLLAPDGWLVYNRLAASPADVKASRDFLEGPFRQVFPEAGMLPVMVNWMLFNRRDWKNT